MLQLKAPFTMKVAGIALTLILSLVSASALDDQPPNGVSMPSLFATNIVPELGYTPKM